MHWRLFKFCSPFIVFGLAWIAFSSKGWYCYLPLIWAFAFIPFVELFIEPNQHNLDAAEEELAKSDKRYDYLLYLIVPFQFGSLFYFLFSLQDSTLSVIDIIGRIISMGLLCGIFGINVGHELGHRANRFEQFLAKALLLSSLYMHFFIEHNKGHHKRVATIEDPASARLGESVFAFYPRTIVFSYIGAWQIANKEMNKKGNSIFILANEMIQFSIIQIVFVGIIFFLFGAVIVGYFLLAAIIGIGLLEAVNYIEHYGLQRKKIDGEKYERALPIHSWNSNHVLGRFMLFELSRHSDHHYLASRKYQILQHHENAPQMPTGYPGMMILAHFPPLFFWVMKKRIQAINN